MIPNYHHPLSFREFSQLVELKAATQSSTGLPNSERIAATKLNASRIRRIEKQTVVSEKIKKILASLEETWIWVVLTESWCGDGAQLLPIIFRISEISDKIELIVLLRDENPEWIESHKTNGSHSIPKLVGFKKVGGVELGDWGPRPAQIQDRLNAFKNENPRLGHDEVSKFVQELYTADKGASFQEEFAGVLVQWKGR